MAGRSDWSCESLIVRTLSLPAAYQQRLMYLNSSLFGGSNNSTDFNNYTVGNYDDIVLCKFVTRSGRYLESPLHS